MRAVAEERARRALVDAAKGAAAAAAAAAALSTAAVERAKEVAEEMRLATEVDEVAQRDAERLARLKAEEDEYENMRMTMRIREAQGGEAQQEEVYSLPNF